MKSSTGICRLTTQGKPCQRLLSVTNLVGSGWRLAIAIAIAQITAVASQVSAQPIFRTPQQFGAGGETLLRLTNPGVTESNEERMAPIRQVGSAAAAASRFQLPLTAPAGGTYQPSSPSGQISPVQSNQVLGNRLQESGLGEVGADGSFLPVQSDFGIDQNQVEEMIDLPGIDLSAMGLDLENQQDREAPEDRSVDSGAAGGELEQLPSALGQFDVPREQAKRTDNVRREQVVENFPDGKPRLIRSVALDREGNYYNDGPWIVKDLGGKVVAAGTYRKGVMQGPWARRHTSAEGGMFAEKPFTSFQGPFDSMANFEGGKLDGQWIVYDRAKRSVFEIGYEDGKRDGLATWFYPDTTKMRQATFKQGVLDGEVSEWDEDGRLVSKEFYTNGRKLIRNTSFYRPEVPKEESYFLDVKLRQNGLDNWWDAKPAPYLASGKRIQNGQARAWYSNRQLQYQGQFRDDKPVGRFFWWHENGNRSTVGQFNRVGDRDGRWIWWHDNGMKRIEGNYKNDQPVGAWRTWDPDGKLVKSKDYDGLSDQLTDSQVNPLDGIDPVEDSQAKTMEGAVELNSAEDNQSGASDSEASGPGQEESGFLPLPRDDSEAGSIKSFESNGALEPSKPAEEEQFETLPPAIDDESTKVQSMNIGMSFEPFSDDGVEVGSSIMQKVGVEHERTIMDRQPLSGAVPGVVEAQPANNTGLSLGTSPTLITEEVDDDAVEPFDLSELLE